MKIRFEMVSGALVLALAGSNMVWADALALKVAAPQVEGKFAKLHGPQYIGQDFDWKLSNETLSTDGNKVLRFVHTYRGIPLFQSESVYVLNSADERIGETLADRRSDLLLFLASKAGASFSLQPSIPLQDAIQIAEREATARMNHAELVLFPVMKSVRQSAALRKSEGELDALDVVSVVDHFELAYQVSSNQAGVGDFLVSARDGRVLQRSDSGEAAGVKASSVAILEWAAQLLSLAGKDQSAVQEHAQLAKPKASHAQHWTIELSRSRDLLESGSPNRQMFHYLAFGDDQHAIKGIGLEQAFRILAKASSEKFTGATDYADALLKMTEAARELYGAGSSEEHAVKQAFAAIRVGGTATLGASSCTRIAISPAYANNTFPWQGGTATATAICSGAQTYSWTLDGAPYGSNGQSISGVLGKNVSGQLWQAQICVTPYNAGTPGIAACTALRQDYLRKPVCNVPVVSPTLVPAAGGNVSATATCTSLDPALTYAWTFDNSPYAGNGRSISGILGLNTSTSQLSWPVCVSATNLAGTSAPVCGLVVQAANSIPRCSSLSFSPSQVPRSGGSVTATASCTGTAITGYSWTANGSAFPGTGSTISNTFPANTGPSSTIQVCVTASNVIGTSAPICRSLTVL